MNKKTPPALAFLGLLIISVPGCVDMTDPQWLQSKQTNELCEWYWTNGPLPPAALGSSWPSRQKAIKAELERRNAVRPDDWSLIDVGQVQTGMSECAVVAAWGATTLHEHVAAVRGSIDTYHYTSGYFASFRNGRLESFIGSP